VGGFRSILVTMAVLDRGCGTVVGGQVASEVGEDSSVV